MVDAHLRLKTINTEDIKNLIIGGQTGIDGIRFVLASSVNGEDLTNASFTWYLQYKNKYGQGESVVLDATVEDNLVKLTWVPDSLATQVPGRLQIQLYATIVEGVGEAAVVTTRWVSEPALIYVQENLSPDPIIQTELSVFDYYLTMYSSFKEAAEAAAAAALASAQAAESSKDNAAQSETNAAQSAAASGDAAIVSQEAEALINAKLLGAFAADPATASAGAVYYNTVQKVLKVYDADSSTWKVAYADASQVGYDNVSSGLESTDLQEAVDELNTKKITRPTSTDKAIPRFSGTSGDIQNSGVTIDDSGNITPTGIFLGGASTANLLDDYEEGSWTPVLSNTYQSFPTEIASSRGKYIKIGNLVVCHFEIEFNTTSVSVVIDDRAIITSLPFVIDLWGLNDGSGRSVIYNTTASGSNAFFDALLGGSASVLLYCIHIDGSPNYASRFLTGYFTYHTLVGE
nr:hypothetical protein [uncultured Sphaerochaeta sp.]